MFRAILNAYHLFWADAYRADALAHVHHMESWVALNRAANRHINCIR